MTMADNNQLEPQLVDYAYALSITSQFFFCGIPFRLDSSPKCSLNCSYCFAMARGGRRTNANQFANPVSFSRKMIHALFSKNSDIDINAQFLRRRMPIHFGGMSDPFADKQTTQVTKKLITIISEHNYPVVISTKNTTRLTTDEIIGEIVKNANVVVQISIPIFSRQKSEEIEGNCPSPNERIKSLRVLKDCNIKTSVRIQPLIPGYEMEVVNDLIPAIAEAGCDHVVVEHLKLAVEKNIALSADFLKSIPPDTFKIWEKYGRLRVGREWLLPSEFRWENIQPIRGAIRANNMTYGAADYGISHLGDTDCCCGLDKYKGFENWFQANFSNILRKTNTPHILFDPSWIPTGIEKSIRRYANSDCRIRGDQSIGSYLLNKWNRPGSENAPDSFLGIQFTGKYDDAKNAIYSRAYV